MRLLEDDIRQLRTCVDAAMVGSACSTTPCTRVPVWPAGRRGNVVLQSETAVELGDPQQESAALLLWTAAPDLVHDGLITVIGPDLGRSVGVRLPFGKAVILAVEGFDEGNCVERHRELELLRYGLNLDGYMMRATSWQGREWARVGRQAVERGFSLQTLAAGLIRLYRSIPYVCAVEVILITSSREAVRSLAPVGETASRRVRALDKMATEASRECDDCDFNDVCSEVEGLRSARGTPRERRSHV